MSIESAWVPVGRAEDVPLLEGRSVTVGARRIAIFRLPDDTWAAVDNACPHKGGPLADGIVADACVTCPLHGRRFDLATGAQHGGDDVVGVYAVRVGEDGTLELLVPAALMVGSA
ncbi:MAG: (2Fe-2S)-binding protein [Solirubrobacterales bacterium]|nr:(2Fe-2S)-binding protein [Solirubrobacterales bacterium]